MKDKRKELRLFNDYLKVKKQKNIAKIHKMNLEQKYQDGYFVKNHILDCGNPMCCICGNPRRNKKVKEKLTIQELKFVEKYNFDMYYFINNEE